MWNCENISYTFKAEIEFYSLLTGMLSHNKTESVFISFVYFTIDCNNKRRGIHWKRKN